MDYYSIYKDLAEKYGLEIVKEDKKLLRISILRLVIFLGGIILTYLAFQWVRLAGIMTMLFFIVIFLSLVKSYARHLLSREHLKNMEKLNVNESKAIKGDYSMFGKGGRYIDPLNDFTNDADIFGEGSLFQYINRTVTGFGSDLLAGWLANPYDIAPEYEARQKSISELASRFEWRQEFLSWGTGKNLEKSQINGISGWLLTKGKGSINKTQKILSFIMPLITAVILGLLIFGVINYPLLIIVVIINLILVGANLKETNRIHQDLTGRFSFLTSLGCLLELIEKEEFDSNIIGTLKKDISFGESSGVAALQLLGSIINKFDNRMNLLVSFLLNGTLLWDFHCLRYLEEWKVKNRLLFPKWLNIIGEVDAYISLANYAYNNHGFVMPVFKSDGTVLDATEFGHPLISADKRVNNDFSITKKGRIVIITGANMAGKSTFLRTVVVNLVLAMIGAPVCAGRMVFSPVRLFTSMRTTDSLSSNESYFYAELKRLKRLERRLLEEEDVFFILDEILKGTNSDDKRAGSVLFLRRIIDLNGTGLIATHDTSLGDIENEYPEKVSNGCIEVEVDGANIKFDYKLKPGIAKNRNAVLLMRQLGIIGS